MPTLFVVFSFFVANKSREKWIIAMDNDLYERQN